MKTSKFTEAQIAFVLKQADEGTAVAEVCQKAGIGATSILKQARRGVNLLVCVASPWVRKVAAVKLADKMARTIWALLFKSGIYRAPTMMTAAKPKCGT